MKPYEIFIPLNFFLSLSTTFLAWGVRVRRSHHHGFCSDPWGADWYILWFVSSLSYASSLLYSFLRGKKSDVQLGIIHGIFYVFTWAVTFCIFITGFLYFTDIKCEALKVFDSILWALGIIGGLVLTRRYPNRITKSVIPVNPNFKNLRY